MGRASFTAAIPLGLVLLWTGCQAKEIEPIGTESFAMTTPEELAQDAKYMAQLFKQRSNGQPFLQLDLGDPRQYAFVIHRLLHAGKTPSSSPRLFQRLREIHAGNPTSSAGNSRAGGVKAAGDVTTANAGGGGTRCGHMLITPGDFAAGMYHADSSALMSCFDGMDYTSLDQAIYETDEDETFLRFLTSNFQEDFAGVEVRTPVLRGSVAAGQGHSVLVDSFGFAQDDITGEFEATYTRYKTEAETPAILRSSSAGQFAALGATNTLDHPRDATGDGIIRLCYKRTFTAGTGDCDYAAINALGQPGVAPLTQIAMLEQNASGQWVPSATERWDIPGAPVSSVPNLLLPLMGIFDPGTRASTGTQCRIQQLPQNDTFATVTLRTTGGWCAGAGTADPTDGGQLWQSLRTNLTAVGGNATELPFGRSSVDGTFDPIIDFGPDCLQNLQDACVQIQVSARTSCNDGVPGAPNFTRTASTEVCFDVRNSCFAAGTIIRRADGSTVAVEKVQVGDKILADGAGTRLTVTATTRGVEPEPMVRLEDSWGHELLLTSKHPVITTMGAMPADEVTVGAQVETEDGIASILEVERVPYDGSVYNLSVGTPDEIARIAGLDRTMFAGGIRVGDNEMQFDLERQRTRERAKRALSPAWETDRNNAMAHKQRAATK
jgi:hypothetical protein